MKKLVAACAFGLFVCSAFAKTNTWTATSSAGNWSKASNWAEDAEIEDGDFVLVPADMTAKAVDADIATIDRLTAILVPAKTSVIEFDVAEDHEIANCYINSTGNPTSSGCTGGKIVKNGVGTLWCNKYAGLYSYLTDELVINDGVFRCPLVDYSSRNMNYGTVTVNAPGVFFPTSHNGQGAGHLASFWCRILGDGVITNPTPYEMDFFPMGTEAGNVPTFAGRIVGPIYTYNQGGSWFYNFTGSGSDNPRACVIPSNAIVGMKEVGGISADGSVTNCGSYGYGPVQISDNGTFVYQGTGAVSHAKFEDYPGHSVQYGKIKGGETGGLRLQGSIAFTGRVLSRLAFGGDHTNACTLECPLSCNANGAFALSKEGAGTWSFLGPRDYNGALFVKDGTLRFDSIDRAGVPCALGLSSILKADVTATNLSEAADVPYAFLLGSAGKTGTMEYLGTVESISSDRAFALAGDGAIKASGGRLVLGGGVTAAAAGTHTLTLGGTAADCVLNGAADGSAGGTVRVVKEGTGTWTLGGDQSFSGGLAVKGGTVRIGDTDGEFTRYRYYRFVMENKAGIAKFNSGTGHTWFNVGRLGFFNEKGEMQNAGLDFNDQARNNPARLAPGEYSYEIGEYVINGNNYKDPYGLYCNAANGSDNLFAVDGAHADAYMAMFHTVNAGSTSWWPYTAGDTVRTVTIVLRLPFEAEPVTSYDVGQHLAWNTTSSGVDGANNIGEWHIEASVDGTTWDTVSTVKVGESYPSARSANCWLKDGSSYATEDGWQKHTTGWTIPPVKTVEPISHTRFANGIDDVSVSGGGTLVTTENLTINSLTVDADAADKSGTINGFAFAEGGTIAVTGAAAKLASVKIPLAFANATNLANVNGWTVSYNGKPVRTVKVYATEGGLELAKTGLSVIVK